MVLKHGQAMNKADCLVRKSWANTLGISGWYKIFELPGIVRQKSAELNHLQENEKMGERPETSNFWEGNILSVVPDGHIAEMVLSKVCETHSLSWFSVCTTV